MVLVMEVGCTVVGEVDDVVLDFAVDMYFEGGEFDEVGVVWLKGSGWSFAGARFCSVEEVERHGGNFEVDSTARKMVRLRVPTRLARVRIRILRFERSNRNTRTVCLENLIGVRWITRDRRRIKKVRCSSTKTAAASLNSPLSFVSQSFVPTEERNVAQSQVIHWDPRNRVEWFILHRLGQWRSKS